MIVAGIDEAGYGPTLGPLVISASVFRVADAKSPPDLWKLLRPAVCRKPDNRRIPIDDSKKLFSQRRGVRQLEEGLLPFITLRHAHLPRDFRDLLAAVVPSPTGDPTGYLESYPWYRGRNVDLPRDTFPGVIRTRCDRLATALKDAQVEHLGLSTYPIEVTQFNRELAQETSKAAVSFNAIGAIVKRLWRQFSDEAVEVIIDRQGGRTKYGPLLYEKLHPKSIRIEEQGPERSIYLLTRRGNAAHRFRVHFAKDSEESFLTVALGSMLSKYVRELHMHLFNRFWIEKSKDLKPTAGYARDARRFLRDIARSRAELRIRDEMLIRRR